MANVSREGVPEGGGRHAEGSVSNSPEAAVGDGEETSVRGPVTPGRGVGVDEVG